MDNEVDYIHQSIFVLSESFNAYRNCYYLRYIYFQCNKRKYIPQAFSASAFSIWTGLNLFRCAFNRWHEVDIETDYRS